MSDLTNVIVSFHDQAGDTYHESELADAILGSDWLNEQLAEAWNRGFQMWGPPADVDYSDLNPYRKANS